MRLDRGRWLAACSTFLLTIGAADASIQTAGPVVSLATRRGTDVFRGSSRLFWTPGGLQSNNVNEERFASIGPGQPLDRVVDSGLEAGGQMVPGRLWWWGSAALHDIGTTTIGLYDAGRAGCESTPADFADLDRARDCLFVDRTRISHAGARGDARIAASQHVKAGLTFEGKTRSARGASALTRPDATQRQEGGTPMSMVQYDWTAPSDVTLRAFGHYAPFGFDLDYQRPELAAVQPLVDLVTGERDRSTDALYADRPVAEVRADATWRMGWMPGPDHGVQVGFGWRRNDSLRYRRLGGGVEARLENGVPASARFLQDDSTAARLQTVTVWVQDRVNWKRLSLSAGVRWDRQRERLLEAHIPAHPVAPEVLPAYTVESEAVPVASDDFASRLSASVDMLGTGRTIASASLAHYYGQGVGFTAYAGYARRSRTVSWTDLNGDRIVDSGEHGTFRFRSIRARSSRVGVSMPDACASVVRNSWYPSPVSRRTMLRNAALASNVVASTAIVVPLTSPTSARRCSTHVNIARWVSRAINRRVREIVE
jgi:hypothetical protein